MLKIKKILLIKFGEVFLRGKNRNFYFGQIVTSIKSKLKNFESCRFENEQGRFLVISDEEDFDYSNLINEIKNIIGITKITIAIMTEDKSLENLNKIAVDYVISEYQNEFKTFKVNTKRGAKEYPIKSPEVSREIGRAIILNVPNFKVDVINPEVIINIEIRTNAYIYSKEIKGLGGLPYSSSGKGVLLLSGGIDSPVAGFLMARRGVMQDFIYFESPPYTSVRALEKVKDIAKELGKYTYKVRLHIVNFTEIQLYLKDNVPNNQLTIFLKRSMLKIAEMLCKKMKGHALIVGDSIGQVASQTMKNIYAIDSSVNTPIIRPLAGLDKEEIINISKEINTYNISIRPFEDCCTIFVPEHPDLNPIRENIEQAEKNLLELEMLLSNAFAEMESIKFKTE